MRFPSRIPRRDRRRRSPRTGGRPSVLPARAPRHLGLATLGVLILALAALVPTVGDFGLTWDEPAYRYSQVHVGPVVGATGPRPLLGRRPGAARSHDAALLLALRAVRHQFPSAAGRPVEPGDLRALRSLDEGHPGAADGVGHRVRPDDHDRLPLPGPALWGLGGRGHGRLAAC